MKVFWKREPLTEHQAKLLNACLEAHAHSAWRENISSVVLCQAAQGSGDFAKSLVAALSTLGGTHAPLDETWEFLESGSRGKKVPGWGNSFAKGSPDPAWASVDTILHEQFPALWGKLNRVTEEFKSDGKNIFPNPSAYTVATAMAIDMPRKLTPWLFIGGRMNTWAVLFLNSINQVK